MPTTKKKIQKTKAPQAHISARVEFGASNKVESSLPASIGKNLVTIASAIREKYRSAHRALVELPSGEAFSIVWEPRRRPIISPVQCVEAIEG